MPISDKTIEQLQAAVATQSMQLDGKTVTTRPVHLVPKERKDQPAALHISTLNGFVDYMQTNEKEKGTIIHVFSHKEVHFIGPLYGECLQRDTLAIASFEELLGKSFEFGKFYEHEAFMILLQSLFVDTDDLRKVLAVIGTIKEESVREHADDGVTQSVTAKAGVALVKEVSVPNPVYLRPYRTFREIVQPQSCFILRARSGQEKPQCALFEADGGSWKLEAINSIRDYLAGKIEGFPIIA